MFLTFDEVENLGYFYFVISSDIERGLKQSFFVSKKLNHDTKICGVIFGRFYFDETKTCGEIFLVY